MSAASSALKHQKRLLRMLTRKENEGKISYVIDCWTSSNQYPFQGVIAKWVNDDWELCQTVLDLTILQGSHEEKNFAQAFWNIIVFWTRF